MKILLSFLLFVNGSFAAVPALFYSDLTSGPKTGGESGNGAYVTVYGKNFGANQGTSTVSVGGGAATNYRVWSDTKVAFQLGSAAATGSIVLTTPAGSSNGLQFTVRSGNIYFSATTGNDNNVGSFASPFKSIQKPASIIAAGDIAYMQNGVSATTLDNYGADLWLGDYGSGTSNAPKAIVAYPGALVTVGTGSATYAGRASNLHSAADYWTLAGIYWISGNAAFDSLNVNGWRFIANEMTCPGGSGQSACFHTDTVTNMQFYGNYVHNVGTTNGAIDKYYHAVYFTTNSNHIDVGWNTIVPNPTGSTTQGGCRALQFFSTGGADQFDLHVHDNLIHDAICDGINFATVNPNAGVVEAYNNVVYHVGTGPTPSNGGGNFSCVLINESGGETITIPAKLYNNTFYDCGAMHGTDAGALAVGLKTVLTNNIISQLSGEVYLAPSSGATSSTISGPNNIWNGGGTAPTFTSGNITSAPQFVNTTTKDFHLLLGSPAINAGVTISSLLTDFDGVTRPQGSAYDIGAFEYASPVAPALPPTNLTGNVTFGGKVVVQ